MTPSLNHPDDPTEPVPHEDVPLLIQGQRYRPIKAGGRIASKRGESGVSAVAFIPRFSGPRHGAHTIERKVYHPNGEVPAV